MMEALDDNTLDELARLICGDDGPVYREGYKLPKLLKRAGWGDVDDHDGSPRRDWLTEQLLARRYVPGAIEKLVLRLADSREYINLNEPRALAETIQQLNGFLVLEGYRVHQANGRPRITECDPTLANPGELAPVELHAAMSDLIRDPQLAAVLQGRLDEAHTCDRNGAHVSAIIMLGSLLEGVLSDAVQTRMPSPVKPAEKWYLKELIATAHGQGWIQADVRKFADHLKEYRDLVHPHAQIRLGDPPDRDTVRMCWPVVNAALNDLAATAPKIRSTRHD
ncbi:MAG: hypothetical protein ACRDRQ_11305 [Pseudonocardiaceae bacterium]